MGESIAKKVELAANVGIIVVAVLGSADLIRHLVPRPPAQPVSAAVAPTDRAARPATASSTPLSAGARIALPGVDWSRHDKTFVLVLSTGCHFCLDSGPFYKRLSAEIHKHAGTIGTVAVFPQPVDEARRFLAGFDVAVDSVLQAPLPSTGARGTPTLVVVDKTGTIEKVWIGRLPPQRENDVLGYL